MYEKLDVFEILSEKEPNNKPATKGQSPAKPASDLDFSVDIDFSEIWKMLDEGFGTKTEPAKTAPAQPAARPQTAAPAAPAQARPQVQPAAPQSKPAPLPETTKPIPRVAPAQQKKPAAPAPQQPAPAKPAAPAFQTRPATPGVSALDAAKKAASAAMEQTQQLPVITDEMVAAEKTVAAPAKPAAPAQARPQAQPAPAAPAAPVQPEPVRPQPVTKPAAPAEGLPLDIVQALAHTVDEPAPPEDFEINVSKLAAENESVQPRPAAPAQSGPAAPAAPILQTQTEPMAPVADSWETGSDEPAEKKKKFRLFKAKSENTNDTAPKGKRITKKKVMIIGAALVLAIVIFLAFAIRIPQVSGSSMEPTLSNGDRVVINKLASDYKVGDVIVFKAPNGDKLVKRIAAVDGDVINITPENVFYRNGEIVNDSFAPDGTPVTDLEVPYPMIVNTDAYFVLGDNRMNSKDSRNSEIGLVYEDQVIGKVIFSF